MDTTIALADRPPTRAFSGPEWQARVDLAACYRLVAHHGWTDQVFNHITLRVPGTEHILINPYGLAYDEITASTLVKIDMEGNKVEESPHPINYTGFVIHSAIHAARPDVACVLHTHSDNATAVSCLEEGFIPMTQAGFQFYQRLGTHDYEGLAFNLAERERLAADLGPTNHSLLLRNHGILITGRTVAEAFSRLYYFEQACGVQLKVMASGGTILRVSDTIQAQTRDLFETPSEHDEAMVEWPAYLRLLDRLDPSYRN